MLLHPVLTAAEIWSVEIVTCNLKICLFFSILGGPKRK